MLSSHAEMARSVRRDDDFPPVDDSWKRRIIAAIKTQGIARADLAKQVGVAPSYITTLLKLEGEVGRTAIRNTRAKHAIERALGIEDKLDQFVRMWSKLDDERQEALLAILRLIQPHT